MIFGDGMAERRCAHCSVELADADADCMACGHAPVGKQLGGTTQTQSSLAVKARHGQHGEVAPHVEYTDTVKWNHDRQRDERCRIYVDRERDFYRQEWLDLETDEVVWSKEGRLRDEEIHGKSARRRRDSPSWR